MKARLKRLVAGVAAALSTPEAVKAEKSIGVLVAVRIALYFGAGAEVVALIQKLFS